MLTESPEKVKAPLQKRGRPRVTSRERILAAALELAAADPSTQVSIVSIARKLGIAPMAIYNYFASKDALMQEISAKLLEPLVIAIPVGTVAFDSIRIWAYSIRAHFQKHPELMQILGWVDGYTSAAWLLKSKELFRALCKLGLKDEELAKTIRWIWNVVMSAISVELHERTTPSVISEIAYGRLDAEITTIVELMRQSAKSIGFQDRFFDFHVSMMVRALECSVER